MSDHSRPLNARGQQAAERMGAYLQAQGISPQAVLVSTSKRTRETLDQLHFSPLPAIISAMDELYLADPQKILEVLRGLSGEIGSVMVIGHNPGMHEVAAFLAQIGAVNAQPALERLSHGFPTSALAEFEIAGNWDELAPDCAKLVRLTVPADLPH